MVALNTKFLDFFKHNTCHTFPMFRLKLLSVHLIMDDMKNLCQHCPLGLEEMQPKRTDKNLPLIRNN